MTLMLVWEAIFTANIWVLFTTKTHKYIREKWLSFPKHLPLTKFSRTPTSPPTLTYDKSV